MNDNRSVDEVTQRRCICRCGYRCGGPGRCADPECLTKSDGKHYVEDCTHKWGEELEDIGFGFSVVCVRCGMSAMRHGMMVGP